MRFNLPVYLFQLLVLHTDVTQLCHAWVRLCLCMCAFNIFSLYLEILLFVISRISYKMYLCSNVKMDNFNNLVNACHLLLSNAWVKNRLFGLLCWVIHCMTNVINGQSICWKKNKKILHVTLLAPRDFSMFIEAFYWPETPLILWLYVICKSHFWLVTNIVQ